MCLAGLGGASGGKTQVERPVGEIQHVAAHVANLADAPVPEHVPLQAVRSRATGEVFRVVGALGRGAKPQVPVQACGRIARCGEMPVATQLAVAPCGGRFEFADRTVDNHFLHPRIVVLRVHLGAALGGEFAFFRQPVGAQRARFLHTQGQRFFAIHAQVPVECPVGNECMVVVGGADHHGVESLVVEALAPINVGLGLRKFLQGMGEVRLIDVANRNHVLLLQPAIVGGGAAPGTDERDVEFVVRRLPGSPDPARQDQQSGGGER